MKGAVGELAAGIFLLAVLFMLVRPGSPAPDLIETVTGAFNALVKLATQG